MGEIPVTIPAEGGRIPLEGRYFRGTAPHSVVICHPHPLYGGSMDNNVVLAGQKAFAEAGWSTLRFNFRGVGRSGGEPGGGEHEVEDLLAASALAKESDPAALLHLAGYSFGAWIGVRGLAQGIGPASVHLFSPPLDFISFEGLALPAKPVLITAGSEDDFCAVQSVRDWISGQSAVEPLVTLEIFPFCDHFYGEYEGVLAQKISAFLRKHFPPDAP